MIEIKRHTQELDEELYTMMVEVLHEFDADQGGTVFDDKEIIQNMRSSYNQQGMDYFLAFYNQKMVAGAGYAPVENEPKTCELQKMYSYSSTRGKGIGKKLIQHVMQKAKLAGYQKMYLETLPQMKAAQSLYKKMGFEYIPCRLGNTGHSACNVWMIKNL